ncbi:hypothetical protein Q7P37_003758 [Cladosporium fusiforme]
MQSIAKPLLRPLPILGILSSTGSLYLATTLSRSSTTTSTIPTTTTMPPNYQIHPYTPRHKIWPYTPSDFTRADASPDTTFYNSPRFVTHIDDAAIASLRQYYDAVLPRQGRILDFCSSWTSHYPEAIVRAASPKTASENDEADLKITAMGLNKAELDANPCANNGRLLIDLNENPDIASPLRSSHAIASSENENENDDTTLLSASTCVVSIDYLTSPVAVLRSLLAATQENGTVHLTVSNRCFPTKATRRWLRVDEEERLRMVGDFLHFAGWKGVEIVVLSDGTVGGGDAQGGRGGWVAGARGVDGDEG